jgi:hypothetical protein
MSYNEATTHPAQQFWFARRVKMPMNLINHVFIKQILGFTAKSE